MKFDELAKVNVNGHTEKKEGLTYLTWSWAWDYFCREFPDATYRVYKNEQGLPYAYDPNTGYMCYVEVTAGGITHEMWLPVMDSANNAMKSEPYTKKTKYKEKHVEAATMFDVNKTIMRCLVKCLAMFGLGLYIYAGEDLPTDLLPDEAPPLSREEIIEKLRSLAQAKNISEEKICELSKTPIESIDDMESEQAQACIDWIKEKF